MKNQGRQEGRGEKGFSHVQQKCSSPADAAEFTQGGIRYN